jgi:hypothetical protein
MIDGDQSRKLDQAIVERRGCGWSWRLRPVNEATQGDEYFHWRNSPGASGAVLKPSAQGEGRSNLMKPRSASG